LMPVKVKMFASRTSNVSRGMKKLGGRWIWIAITLMLASAYCSLRWIGLIGAVSGWTGLAYYEAQIPKLQVQARLWSASAIILLFAAAAVLGLGQAPRTGETHTNVDSPLTSEAESAGDKWTGRVIRYLGHLVVAVSGTLVFLVLLTAVGFVFYKLRIHP
jgi:hypothetical protein